jgi:hypothetical protein
VVKAFWFSRKDSSLVRWGLILDRLIDIPEVLNQPKSVQDHLDYDRCFIPFLVSSESSLEESSYGQILWGKGGRFQ